MISPATENTRRPMTKPVLRSMAFPLTLPNGALTLGRNSFAVSANPDRLFVPRLMLGAPQRCPVVVTASVYGDVDQYPAERTATYSPARAARRLELCLGSNRTGLWACYPVGGEGRMDCS